MNLNDMKLFVQAVDSGGFAAAARLHATPKSTYSKRVAMLEENLGVRLVERNSRAFRLSSVGKDFYEHARAALIEIEEAEQVVHRRLAEPSGVVRLTAAVPVVQFQLAALLPVLAQTHPKLQLQLHASDRFVDLLQEGFDIAVRSHFAALPDSGLVQRRLSHEPIFLVAAPGYLARHGTPRQPRDLARHAGLLTGPHVTQWRLRASSKQRADAMPLPRMVADESVALLQAASAGLGITCLPESICRQHLEQRLLVRVLPRWTAGSVTTTLLVSERRGQLPSVRAVVDFLVSQFSDDSRGFSGSSR